MSATMRINVAGTNYDIPVDFTIPIFPGDNINIDANAESDGVKISLSDVIPITTDEIRSILEDGKKHYTQIKIDEITNLGAVKIRLRSLIGALEDGEENAR